MKEEDSDTLARYLKTASQPKSNQGLSLNQRIKKLMAEKGLSIDEVIELIAGFIQENAAKLEQDDVQPSAQMTATYHLKKDFVRQIIADALKTKRQGCLIEMYDREAAMKAICGITEERYPHPKSNDGVRQFIARKVGELAECESISRAEALALLKSLKPDWVALQEYEEEDAKLLDFPTCLDGWTPEEERFLKGLAQDGLKREGGDEDDAIASR